MLYFRLKPCSMLTLEWPRIIWLSTIVLADCPKNGVSMLGAGADPVTVMVQATGDLVVPFRYSHSSIGTDISAVKNYRNIIFPDI